MAVELYLTPGSPPCRLVLLVAAALNVPLNLHHLDLSAQEHLKPEFLALNPQHTVPTIVDEGFVLWESRAIGRYLVNAYGAGGGGGGGAGAGSGLYPPEPKPRALVDQRLDFDFGTLYSSYSKYFYPQLFGGKADPALFTKLEEAIRLLDSFLAKTKYAAGEDLTLADLALVATVSTIDAAGIVDLKSYPNVFRWYELVKATAPKYKEANEEGLEQFKKFISKLKAKTEL